VAGFFPITGDLPPALPLFPLEGVLLLPHAWLPLHVFEPRYVAMVNAILATQDRLVGMIQPDRAGLAMVGCAGRISSFTETLDGTYMITLRGISRFHLLDTQEDANPWLTGSVSWSAFNQDLGEESRDVGFDQSVFLNLLGRYSKMRGREMETAARKGMAELSVDALVSEVAMSGGFSAADKQGILEAPDLGERRALLVNLMQFALHGDKGKGRMQ